MRSQDLPFAERVALGIARRGLTLRSFCRAVCLDPSFFSKVLSGKRNPPSEERILRRIAEILEIDAVELIVAAGRIPSEWRALWEDTGLFCAVNSLAAASQSTVRAQQPPLDIVPRCAKRRDLSEELL